MSHSLFIRVKKLLKTLEPLQEATLALFERKRAAVTLADPAEMLRLADVENDLSRKLQEALGARHEILQEARRSGLPSGSLLELVSSLEENDGPSVSTQIKTARRKAERIRRESWVQWVVSRRANTYYNELLELISHSGRKAPVYGDRPGASAGGGTILDASA
jgi:hypothetical protein